MYLIPLMLFHLFILSFIERGGLNFEAMIIGLFVSSSLSIFFFPCWDVGQLCLLYLFHLTEMAVLSDTMVFITCNRFLPFHYPYMRQNRKPL